MAALTAAVAGWGFSRTLKDADVGTTVLTVFAALTAHSGLQCAFIDGRLDVALGDPRAGSPLAVVILIAAGEAAGLWVPVLVLRWARLTARLWAGLYMLASLTVAASYHYFPFDLVVVRPDLVADNGPPYLAAVFACLPIFGLGYLVGRTGAGNRDLDEDAQVEL